eukprot:3166979-Rhodomonas_salina.1
MARSGMFRGTQQSSTQPPAVLRMAASFFDVRIPITTRSGGHKRGKMEEGMFNTKACAKSSGGISSRNRGRCCVGTRDEVDVFL